MLQEVPLSEGYELTREVYRWDQRLFSVVLRLPGMGGPSSNTKDPLPSEAFLAKLAEATGGMLCTFFTAVSFYNTYKHCIIGVRKKLL